MSAKKNKKSSEPVTKTATIPLPADPQVKQVTRSATMQAQQVAAQPEQLGMSADPISEFPACNLAITHPVRASAGHSRLPQEIPSAAPSPAKKKARPSTKAAKKV